MVSTDLGGPEAEGGGGGVALLPVLQHQSAVLSQGQVMAGGEVAQPEGLTPANVAPAPAEHREVACHRQIRYHQTSLAFWRHFIEDQIVFCLFNAKESVVPFWQTLTEIQSCSREGLVIRTRDYLVCFLCTDWNLPVTPFIIAGSRERGVLFSLQNAEWNIDSFSFKMPKITNNLCVAAPSSWCVLHRHL